MLGFLGRSAGRVPFSYPDAGKGADPLVQKAVALFRRLPLAARKRAGPLLYKLIGPHGTPPFKMHPQDANYGPPPEAAKGQTCGSCDYAYQHVVSQGYICSAIRGPIRPQDWCRLWVPFRRRN